MKTWQLLVQIHRECANLMGACSKGAILVERGDRRQAILVLSAIEKNVRLLLGDVEKALAQVESEGKGTLPDGAFRGNASGR